MEKRPGGQKISMHPKRIWFRSLFCIAVGLLPLLSVGQYFTIEDIEVNRLRELAPESYKNMHWRPETSELIYSSDSVLYIRDFKKREKPAVLFSLAGFNEVITTAGLELVPEIPELYFHSKNELVFKIGNQLALLNIDSAKCQLLFQLQGLGAEYKTDTNLNYLAFPKGNNLFLKDGEANLIRITNDSIPGVVNGKTVYRREFGMESGLSWSPRGNYLAYYRNDESRVTKYPLVKSQKPIATHLPVRYPMAGMNTQETEIWIYKLADESSIKLNIPYKEFAYHTNLSWTADEERVYLQHLNRDQDMMSLRAYSVETGDFLEEIITEEDLEYIEPQYPLVFSRRKSRSFYYQSSRTGYNHIFFYDHEKKQLEQLTTGNWQVTEFLGADTADENIFFLATKESPLERHFYKLNLPTRSLSCLTSSPGIHTIKLSPDLLAFIDDFTNMQVPHSIQVANINDKDGVLELLNAPNPIQNYELGKTDYGTIKGGDKRTELFYRLTLPSDFDSTRRYPAVFYVYGGPHVQLIQNSWLDRVEFLGQYFAQNGILFFTLDPRGSEARGMDFEQIIHRQNGIPQMQDYVRGVEFLKSKSFVDETQLGITGWSFGGFMTIAMMLNYPGVFKAGVAGGPVTDWKLYEVMYGERYMDTPQQNPIGYERTNLMNIAGNLQDDLLIIHGALDSTVVMQHSLEFLQACIEANRQVDFFIYPTHPHNVSGKDRVHLTRMITEYFMHRFGKQ